MMTMTELFYGPVEPTWIVQPQYPTSKTANAENPYMICPDEAFVHRRNPYMQRNGGLYGMRPGHGAMYPYQAQYFVHGANGLNSHANHGNQVHHKHEGESPVRAGVLQPRNAMNVQTLHFMVPLCCGKCEDRVKEQLLDLDDVQRVTCDQWKQKVTVTSSIAPERLLKRLQKIKKRTTFWPHHKFGVAKVFNGNRVSINDAHQQQNVQKGNDNENQVGSNDQQR